MRVRKRLAIETAKEILSNHPEAVSEGGSVDPLKIANAYGIDVRYFNLEENLSGFMLMEDGQAMIGVNAGDGPKRQRYTLGHELAHYFLHDRSEPFLDPRTAHVQIIPRNEISSLGVDPREIEANIFAAELLMPEERLRDEVEKLGRLGLFDEQDNEIKELADKFDVSVRAMTIRLERLGYLEGV